MRACKNCGAAYENIEDESWTWQRRVLSFLCPSCGALLVAESERLSEPDSQMQVLSHLVRMVKEGKRFKTTMLSPGLIWDGDSKALSPYSPASHAPPSVRRVRQKYLRDGDYVQFCLALDEAIRLYGLKEEDFVWYNSREDSAD